jgi:hypothetical protein
VRWELSSQATPPAITDSLFRCPRPPRRSVDWLSSVVMGSEMAPETAAERLEEQFRRFPWFVAVGVGTLKDGKSAIFLYVKSKRHQQLKSLESGWMGYDVILRQIGSIRPLAGTVGAYS